MGATEHAVRRVDVSRIATREVVWAAWRSKASLRVFRMAIRVLGAIAMVFFCAYYSYLVLVFGATFSEARLQTWLVEACVSMFLSETVITGFALTLRLFVSYVVSRLLWTLDGSTKRDIGKSMGASDTAGSDQQGPLSLHGRRSSPTVTRKLPIILPQNRYRRKSRSGTVMCMESMSPTVTKKARIVLPETRRDDKTRSENIMDMVSISDI